MGTAAYRGKGQGKGKGRGEGRGGQGGRGRSKGGEKPMGTTAYGGKGSKGRAANGDRPVGAASCRQDHHTMASCQNPPFQCMPVLHSPTFFWFWGGSNWFDQAALAGSTQKQSPCKHLQLNSHSRCNRPLVPLVLTLASTHQPWSFLLPCATAISGTGGESLEAGPHQS